MGKLGRFACILTPMLCTLASLICTLIIIIGGTNSGSKPISGLYFFSIDTRYITTPSSIDLVPGVNIDNELLKTGFNMTSKDLGLADFYTSSLWNYCSGTINGDVWTITECSKPSATYFFDPIHILNVSSTSGANEINFPDSIKKINKAVGAVTKVMNAMYVLGFAATVVTFFIGWFGLLSRWGSCITTILADIAFLFLLIGSIIATALYYSMAATYNKAFKDFSVAAATNKQMYTITWVAVAFALAASVFWMFSTCCCSGKKSRIMGTEHNAKGGKAVKTGAGYERIAAPYQGGSVGGHSGGVPMTEVGKKQAAAYEPYRHQ